MEVEKLLSYMYKLVANVFIYTGNLVAVPLFSSPFLFLMQLLAGLSKPTSGSITIQRYGNDGNPSQSSEPLAPESVGMVFQFPERYTIILGQCLIH